jgi:GNAT superfamily N-acetyltransferase
MIAHLTVADATPAHFAAIAEIERGAPSGSLVVLTGPGALEEAFARGHYLVVALENDAVLGWAWFSVDAGRGGEEIGLLYRIAVARRHQRRGVGRALLDHVRHTLAARSCTRLRATFGDDDGTRAFLADAGFAVDAITMERPL